MSELYQTIKEDCLTLVTFLCSFIMRGSGALNSTGRSRTAVVGRQQKQRCVTPRAAIAEPPTLKHNARSSNGAAKPIAREGPTIIDGQVMDRLKQI